MGNIKDIFKIFLVTQLVSCALAYGHPDAETIDFGSPSQPSRDQAIIAAAIKRGMDGEAVAELLRTKQPVVRTVTTPAGFTKTTTYKLEDDGSITSKTSLKSRNRYTYNSATIPDSIPIDDLRKSPTGTITRTFTNENGDKVTQTIGLSEPKPSTALDTDDLNGDWFSKPFPEWPEEKPLASPASTVHRTVTRTFTGPNGERRTVQSWSSEPDFSEFETPLTTTQSRPSYKHRTVTRTYTGPNGEKRVTQTTSNHPDSLDLPKKPTFSSPSNEDWPGFDFSSLSQPWETTGTDDTDDWVEVEGNPDVETTTKKKFESWTPKTWNWPAFTTSTTTAKPKVFIEHELKPLPTLEDFLKSQYGPGAGTTPKSINTPKTSKGFSTTTPAYINLEDLPVTDILYNGQTADETILKNLPPHLTPTTKIDNVLHAERTQPVEKEIEVFTPKVETNVRTYSKTHSGSQKPTIKDLDPQMQEILKKAGISPEDITNIEGDTITKTRTDPDGRVITTTYKVKTLPSIPVVHTVSPKLHSTPPHATHSFDPYKPIIPSLTPLAPFTPSTAKPSSIKEFLAQLGLSKYDISSQNGRLTKTFIDDNGDVLTATFILSSPQGKKENENESKKKPFK